MKIEISYCWVRIAVEWGSRQGQQCQEKLERGIGTGLSISCVKYDVKVFKQFSSNTKNFKYLCKTSK